LVGDAIQTFTTKRSEVGRGKGPTLKISLNDPAIQDAGQVGFRGR
jgi:hypothetical protein